MKKILFFFFIFFISINLNSISSYANDIDYNNIYQINESKDNLFLCNINETSQEVQCGFFDFTTNPIIYDLYKFDGTTLEDYSSIKIIEYQNNFYFKLKNNFYKSSFSNKSLINLGTDLSSLNHEIQTIFINYFNGNDLSNSVYNTYNIKNNSIFDNGFKILKNIELSTGNIQKAIFSNNRYYYCIQNVCYKKDSDSKIYKSNVNLSEHYTNPYYVPIKFQTNDRLFIYNESDNFESNSFSGTIQTFSNNVCEKINIDNGTITNIPTEGNNIPLQNLTSQNSCFVSCSDGYAYNPSNKTCDLIQNICNSTKISNGFQKSESTNISNMKNQLDNQNCFNIPGTYPFSVNFTYKQADVGNTSFSIQGYSNSDPYYDSFYGNYGESSGFSPGFVTNSSYRLSLGEPTRTVYDDWGWVETYTNLNGSITNNQSNNTTPFYINMAYGNFDSNSFYCINSKVSVQNGFSKYFTNSQNQTLCSSGKISYLNQGNDKVSWACDNGTTENFCESRINYCSKESILNGTVSLGTPTLNKQLLQANSSSSPCFASCNFGFEFVDNTQSCDSRPVEQCVLNGTECSFSNGYSVKYYYTRGYDSRYKVDLYKDGNFVKNIRNQQDGWSNIDSCASYANFTAAYFSGNAIHFLGTHIVTANRGPGCGSLYGSYPVDFVYKIGQ